MKKLAGFILTLNAAVASAQGTVTIKGNVTGDTKGYNKIYLYGQNIPRDSAVLNNGSFTFTFPYVKGCTPILYSEYESKVHHAVSPFSAVIEGPCDLTLKDADITKGLGSGTWSGSIAATDYQTFSRELAKNNEAVKAKLQEKYPGKDYKDSTYRSEATKLYHETTVKTVTSFVQTHPDSYASAIILRGGRTSFESTDLDKTYRLLSSKQQTTEAGQEVASYIVGLKNSEKGSKVNDFTLPDPDEKAFTFSSLKGKYVVIDFWASWCGPCKASFPHMKEVYSKFKGKNFEILSISIDKDKQAWLKEVKNQSLPWLQTLDTKNISQSGFAIAAVPTTYLIDPDGAIVMKEIGFDSSGNGALEKKLNELLK